MGYFTMERNDTDLEIVEVALANINLYVQKLDNDNYVYLLEMAKNSLEKLKERLKDK